MIKGLLIWIVFSCCAWGGFYLYRYLKERAETLETLADTVAALAEAMDQDGLTLKEALQWLQSASAQGDGCASVSYTHLDVYKRQAFNRYQPNATELIFRAISHPESYGLWDKVKNRPEGLPDTRPRPALDAIFPRQEGE